MLDSWAKGTDFSSDAEMGTLLYSYSDLFLNAVTQRQSARVSVYGTMFSFLVLALATGLPIYNFKAPVWVNEEKESYDLALCFHIDNYHASKSVQMFKLVVATVFVATIVYVYIEVELQGIGALDFAYFVGFTNFISLYALMRLFPFTEPAKGKEDQLTYEGYQRTVLGLRGPENMANDNNLRYQHYFHEATGPKSCKWTLALGAACTLSSPSKLFFLPSRIKSTTSP